jgi:glycosyltransferase involved in cell wall biosynthesis
MPVAPYVTVGLPVYNGERLLGRAVESLLAQTFENFELVISDNGSTDRTESICRAFAGRDPRVRYHRNAENVGAARNFNRVFELGRAPYFRWAAHDDMCRPDFLARCVEVLDREPDVSLVYTRAVDVDEQDRPIKEYAPSSLATQARAADRVRDLLRNPSPCFEAFALMRREQLSQTDLIGAYTASDRTLLLEMAMRGRFHQVPEVLFLHGQHAERSVARFRCARAMNAWFDPSRAGKFTFPTWRLMNEYRRAIRRAPVDRPTRSQCERHLARWASANARPLAREVAAGVRHLSLRTVGGAVHAVDRLRHSAPIGHSALKPTVDGTGATHT